MSKTSSALIQDLKPVSKKLFRTSKTRLRALIQDLKPVSKKLFKTSETKVKISHSRPQTSFKDLV
jgi:hypothetical protein